MLISAPAIDKRRAFYKWLKANAEISLFDRIDVSRDGWEDKVAKLVLTRAKELGLTFEQEALQLFVQLAGEDTRQINNEVAKLELYLTPATEVTVEAVQLMVPASRKGVIWEISRAIENRAPARAIELIDAQLAKGESAVGLIRAAIIPTVRSQFFARLALEAGVKGGNYGSFQSALERLPPEKKSVFPKKKDGKINAFGMFSALPKVAKTNSRKLKEALCATLEADRALVTTALDERLVLHRLVVQLVS